MTPSEGAGFAPGPLVELSGVGLEVGKPTRTRILHPTDLRIDAGERIAIVGPSGAGKTTLASIIGALQQPSEGGYRFAGQELVGQTRAQLARFRSRHVGFVFQRADLIEHRTARANVELGITQPLARAERRDLSSRALRRVGLEHLEGRLAAHLSGGEQQRVAIARALVKSPSLIIADEPTSALDQHTGQMVLDLLADIGEAGTTLILVTHDRRAVASVRRTVTIVDGAIA